MPESELLEAVQDMAAEARGLREEVAAVKAAGQKNRRMIWITIGSVVFDIALSVGLFYAVGQSDQAARAATKASSSGVVSCRARNASNEVQRTLWDTILAFPLPENESPEAKERRLKFTAYLDTAFATENCE